LLPRTLDERAEVLRAKGVKDATEIVHPRDGLREREAALAAALEVASQAQRSVEEAKAAQTHAEAGASAARGHAAEAKRLCDEHAANARESNTFAAIVAAGAEALLMTCEMEARATLSQGSFRRFRPLCRAGTPHEASELCEAASGLCEAAASPTFSLKLFSPPLARFQ
jgi:hypothetical protein